MSSIESCSSLPLEYVRNVCVDGRNTIFIKPLARNVCQIIMIKSWRKVILVSVKKKARKRSCFKITSFLSWSITTNLSGGDLCFFCMFIVQDVFYVFFYSMKCNTEAHQYLSAIRQHGRGEVLLLILIVAMKNTICFKLETSGRSIKPDQALSQNGPILRLKLSKFLLRRFEVYYSFPIQTVQHRGCCYAWTTIY